MAKVLKFPVKKELPKEVEERLYKITETYIKSMDEVVNDVCDDTASTEEYAETLDLMLNVVLEGLLEAIGKLGES